MTQSPGIVHHPMWPICFRFSMTKHQATQGSHAHAKVVLLGCCLWSGHLHWKTKALIYILSWEACHMDPASTHVSTHGPTSKDQLSAAGFTASAFALAFAFFTGGSWADGGLQDSPWYQYIMNCTSIYIYMFQKTLTLPTASSLWAAESRWMPWCSCTFQQNS